MYVCKTIETKMSGYSLVVSKKKKTQITEKKHYKKCMYINCFT